MVQEYLQLHLDEITAKASQLNACISLSCSASARWCRISSRTPVSDLDFLSSLNILYTTIIRSVTEYACHVWHTSLTTTTKQLENIQKWATCIHFVECVRSIATPSPLQNYHRFAGLCLRACSYSITSTFSCLPMTPNYAIRNARDYSIPRCRTEPFDNCFVPHRLQLAVPGRWYIPIYLRCRILFAMDCESV